MRRMQAWMVGAALAGFSAGTGGFLPEKAWAQVSQDQVWIQIEAKNSRARIEERLRYWAQTLPNVSGFLMASGWYAAALGPFERDEAVALLKELRMSRAIPSDSFIADDRIYRSTLEPVAPAFGAGSDPAPISGAEGAPTAAIEIAPLSPAGADRSASEPSVPPVLVEESLAEARRNEGLLSRDERMDIQRALIWAGSLSGTVDGVFGRGTRGAISDWQSRTGAEATGFLTSAQRRVLVEGWKTEVAALGLETVRDEEAGIMVDLPLALVAFDAYQPPFARYAPKSDSGLEIRLISLPGDQHALDDLFGRIEASGLVPLGGLRDRRERGFDLSGAAGETEGHAWAELSQGVIKGYLVTARRADGARTARVLQLLQTSFRSLDGQVLDPGLVPLAESAKAAMLTGIEKSRPKRAGSGFYATSDGQIVTAASVVEGCRRITLDGGVEAQKVAGDALSGVAILRPGRLVAPKAVARFGDQLPRAGTEVVVSGYSFGSDLPLPSATFGRFAAPNALDGSSERARLDLAALGGDVGGPVLGEDGLVIGVLQGAPQDEARDLPAGVSYMTPAPLAFAALARAVPSLEGTVAPGLKLPAEDLSRLGREMAAQVLCWE